MPAVIHVSRKTGSDLRRIQLSHPRKKSQPDSLDEEIRKLLCESSRVCGFVGNFCIDLGLGKRSYP